MSDNGQLTEKQKRFCEEYLIELNATQAAIMAEYTKNPAAAADQGYRNLQNPKIRNYIREQMFLRCMRTQITSDKVIEELWKVAFDENENITTCNKLKALSILAKHVGLFDKQNSEYPEILKEKEPELKEETVPFNKNTWSGRIYEFLGPETQREFLRALEKENENPETIQVVTDKQILKFMKKQLGEKCIKDKVLAKVDSVISRA